MVDLALAATRVVLAAVFLAAGLAKLTDRGGSRQAPADLGVPRPLRPILTPGLPLAELAVALALLPTSTAWWGALGGLALLVAFVGAVAANLARGRRPSCRCFGQLSPGPIGPMTLVRNVVLLLAAGVVVWQGPSNPGPSIVGWLGDLTPVERIITMVGLVGLVLLAGTMVLAFQLMKQQGRLLMRIEALERSLTAGGAMVQTPEQPALPGGLPIGARAPGFTLPDLAGTSVSLDSLLTTRPLLLLFTDPHCGPCAALLPEVGRWQREYADRLAIAVISRGAPEQYRARAAEHGIATVLFQSDYEVADLFQVNDAPGAVLVRLDGTIGSPVASGGEQIRALVAYVQSERAPEPWVNLPHIPVINTAGHDHSHPPALPPVPSMGEPAPPVILPGLDGQSVDLAEFRGSATLVLFWSPGCPFCLQVLPDLQAWEAEPPVDAPRLLVVSAGTAEEHRGLGLRAPIGLDPGFTIGPAFGADGTPSAVVIDAEGRIASGLAVGGPAVLALAGMAPGQRSSVTA